MKTRLLAYSAIAAVIAGAPLAARADDDDQTPETPAGTRYDPAPTMSEELVYLRDIIALQTLRLDEAEQALARQNALIEAQQSQIASLDQMVRGLTVAVAAGPSTLVAAGGHVVQSGDTLGEIASQYGTSVAALASANGIAPPYTLRVGQRLAVPGAAPAVAMAAAAPTAPATAPQAAETQQAAAAPVAVAPQAQASPSAAEPQAQRVAANDQPAGPAPQERSEVTERAIAQQREDEEQPGDSGTPQEVGVRPEDEGRPYLSIFSDIGGILTPKGSLYVEPSVDFTATSDNRFFFQGVEIVDAILVGAIEATDSDRRATTESLSFRYGINSRIELDGRISYIQRHDRISGVAIDDATTTLRELDGSGLGDAEVGLHYQINRGLRWPYAVFNFRAKAPTGTGPFDVARAVNGIETELATGSGYWSLEPSLTFIIPSDPAVIFGNVGYQFNMGIKPDAIIGNTTVREYEPGDAIRTSLGVGLSLNERLSVNFGYDQSYFFSTESLIEFTNDNGEVVLNTSRQPSATVGSFLFGGSYALNERIRLNFNTAFGATDEAPDMRVSLRAQIRLFD